MSEVHRGATTQMLLCISVVSVLFGDGAGGGGLLLHRHAGGAVMGLANAKLCGADDGDRFHRHPTTLQVCPLVD